MSAAARPTADSALGGGGPMEYTSALRPDLLTVTVRRSFRFEAKRWETGSEKIVNGNETEKLEAKRCETKKVWSEKMRNLFFNFSQKEAKTKRNGSRFANNEKKKEAKQAHYHCCVVPETFPAR